MTIRRNNKEILKFPASFLWGVSTSAYQIEGGITNDWSEWEMSHRRVRQLKKQDKNYQDYICGKGCNSYEKYKEDIDLVKKLNCGAYRFGVEWARLEPIEGEFNQEEFEHYKEVLAYAKKKGLKVMLTIWHWTNPLWLTYEGGWTNKKVVKYFKRFTEKLVKELGKDVDYWITLNEPMIHVVNGYIRGNFPPKKRSLFKANKVFNNLVEAHNKAYRVIHKKYKKAQVSFTKLTNDYDPARKWLPSEIILAKTFNYLYNDRFLQRVKRNLDFIGVDYYFHNRVITYPPYIKNKNKKTTDMGWEIYPKGLYNVLMYLKKFKKPIIIVENGIADAHDKKRPDFIKGHLKYLHKAIQDGAPVKGYFHWSLLDNFEWAEGWWPKFGLFEVDRETFERRPKASAKLYAKIVKNNQLDI